MAPWWWFLREPKHVGTAFIFLMCVNNPTIYIIECISWTMKYLILLMHGATMKIPSTSLLTTHVTWDFVPVAMNIATASLIIYFSPSYEFLYLSPSLLPSYSFMYSYIFLGAFAKLRRIAIGFVMSVRPSAWNNSAPSARIFMKFYTGITFRKSVENIQVSWKAPQNNGYFTRRTKYKVIHKSLRDFRTRLRNNQHRHGTKEHINR